MLSNIPGRMCGVATTVSNPAPRSAVRRARLSSTVRAPSSTPATQWECRSMKPRIVDPNLAKLAALVRCDHPSRPGGVRVALVIEPAACASARVRTAALAPSAAAGQEAAQSARSIPARPRSSRAHRPWMRGSPPPSGGAAAATIRSPRSTISLDGPRRGEPGRRGPRGQQRLLSSPGRARGRRARSSPPTPRSSPTRTPCRARRSARASPRSPPRSRSRASRWKAARCCSAAVAARRSEASPLPGPLRVFAHPPRRLSGRAAAG